MLIILKRHKVVGKCVIYYNVFDIQAHILNDYIELYKSVALSALKNKLLST